MRNHAGVPIWYELIAPDADVAQAFYASVLGWRFERPENGIGVDYRIAHVGEASVAAVMQRPEGMATPDSWLIYFGVDDVDAAVGAAEGAGGAVHMPPFDLPGVGRLAFLGDPQGASFYLMRGVSESASTAFVSDENAAPGHGVWNELSAPDPEAALAFYGTLLGLRQEGGMPMGDLGEYRFVHVGSTCIGALMGPVPNGRPGWLVYFSVPDIDAALERLQAAGGSSLQGPDEIPGGSFSLVAQDPAGARFGLVGRRP